MAILVVRVAGDDYILSHHHHHPKIGQKEVTNLRELKKGLATTYVPYMGMLSPLLVVGIVCNTRIFGVSAH
jgi:NADH:ubiquinone oxidoreductase subunit 6 (subunit J)